MIGRVDWKWLLIGAILGWLVSGFTCHKSYSGAYPTIANGLLLT